jgi:DNA polymerase-3 subunit gamma/tau
VVHTLGSVPRELALTPDADARLADQAQRTPRAVLVRLLDLLGRAREATRAGADARTQLELALVKAATPAVDGTRAALVARIERLEAGPVGSQSIEPPQAMAPAEPAATFEPAASVESPAAETPVAPVEPFAAAPVEPVAASEPADAVESPAEPEVDAEVEPAEPEPAAAPRLAAEPVEDLDALRSRWSEALELIRDENALLGALIAEGQPVGLQDNEVTVAFPPTAAFSKRKAEDRVHRVTVTDKLSLIVGRPVQLSYELRDGIVPAPRRPGEEELIARLIAELDAVELP